MFSVLKFMKRLIVLLMLFMVLFSSCTNKDVSQNAQKEIVVTGTDTLELSTPTNFKPVIPLTPEAKKGVLKWSFYTNLTTAVDSLQATSLGALKINLKRFDNLYLSQEEADEAEVPLTPEIVQTKAVQARLIALETKTKSLQNHVQLNAPDASQISEQIGEVHNAYQDLNLQLNELFDTSFNDLLEEIKQENAAAENSEPEE